MYYLCEKLFASSTTWEALIGIYISIITLNGNGLSALTKRQTGGMNIEIRSIYMLPTRYSLLIHSHVQTESEGMEKYIPH